MDWIRRLAWKSTENEFLKRVPLLLGETKAKPIGMGKGQFMINENFLYRVIYLTTLAILFEYSLVYRIKHICIDFSFLAGLDPYLFYKHSQGKQRQSRRPR